MAISGSRYQAAIDELRTRLQALTTAATDVLADADRLADDISDLDVRHAPSASSDLHDALQNELDRARALLEAHTAGRKP